MQLKEDLYYFSNKWKFKHIQWNAFQIKLLYDKNMKIAYHHNKKEKDITRNRRWILRLFLRVCSKLEKKLCTCRNISKKKSVILKVKSFMPPTDSKILKKQLRKKKPVMCWNRFFVLFLKFVYLVRNVFARQIFHQQAKNYVETFVLYEVSVLQLKPKD